MIDRWGLMLGELQPLPEKHPGGVRVHYADQFGDGSLKLLDKLFGRDPDDEDVPRPPRSRCSRSGALAGTAEKPAVRAGGTPQK